MVKRLGASCYRTDVNTCSCRTESDMLRSVWQEWGDKSLTCRLASSFWKWGIALDPAEDREGPREESGSSEGRLGSSSCVNTYVAAGTSPHTEYKTRLGSHVQFWVGAGAPIPSSLTVPFPPSSPPHPLL